jgi:CBS domain-containing protein
MHILLADDQPQVRSALRLLLEHEAEIQKIDEVTNAQDLLAHAQTNHLDLILLDWELPGLSSRNVLPALRECSPDLSVIALSGRLEARQMALDAGADAFVSKGEPPEHLLTELRKIENGGYEKMNQEMVKDWMSREVVTISPDTTLPEAHRLMTEKQIRRLPVVAKNHLAGIVTLGDVREAEPSDATSLSIWEVNYLLAKLNVEEIMTRNPITIFGEATIGEAAQVMLANKISGLPVVDSRGALVGIITESDIFRIVVQKWGSIEGVEKLGVASYG